MKKNKLWAKLKIREELERWWGVEGGIDEDGINYVLNIIDQLDAPEVLTQEWVDKNVIHIRGLGDIFEAEAVESIILPNQELPVIPNFVGEFIKARKHTDAYNLQYIFHTAMENSESDRHKKEYDWIRQNDESFARAWLGGYTVADEPLYYALVKGHELLGDSSKYWAHNKYDSEDLFISYDTRDDSPIIVKNTKNRWDDLGVNDSNADFIRVEDI